MKVRLLGKYFVPFFNFLDKEIQKIEEREATWAMLMTRNPSHGPWSWVQIPPTPITR